MANGAKEEANNTGDNWQVFGENHEVLGQQIQKMSILEQDLNTSTRGPVVVLGPESNPFHCQAPKIMILRRPDKDPADDVNTILSQKQKQPVKSFAQRQAEYAEARRRILGAAGSCQSEDTAPSNSPKAKTTIQKSPEQKNSDLSTPNKSQHQNTRISILPTKLKSKCSPPKALPTVKIIRTPREPPPETAPAAPYAKGKAGFKTRAKPKTNNNNNNHPS